MLYSVYDSSDVWIDKEYMSGLRVEIFMHFDEFYKRSCMRNVQDECEA